MTAATDRPLRAAPEFDLASRLQRRVHVDHIGCWLWNGSRDAGGYPTATIAARRGFAHRLVYELLVGVIPAGLELDHLCRVRHCVNPDHLEPVTKAENIRRSYGLGALRARQQQCRRGHPLTGENLSIATNGRRRCLTCRRASAAEFRARARAAA